MFLSEKEQSKLKYSAKEIGKILRKEHLGKYSTFEEGEKILREELLNHENPDVAQNFFALEASIPKFDHRYFHI